MIRLVLSAGDVEWIVSDFTPRELQLLMAQVFHFLSTKRVVDGPPISMPHRLSFQTQNHTALFMPARIGDSAFPGMPGRTAIKVVCVPQSTAAKGLPATTMVLDEITGGVKAIVNARKLTALRNAAGSLLSTNILTTSEPESIVAFGAGQQIESHLDLHLRHFPSLKHCTIVNRTRNSRALSLQNGIIRKFANRNMQVELIAHHAGEVIPESKVHSALGRADIIVCATSSTIPLFLSSSVRDGTHIILIGSYRPDMKEVDNDLISRSLKGMLVVDSKDACLREAGELIDASVRPEEMKELGELLPTDSQGALDVHALDQMLDAHRPKKIGTSFDGPVTIFKSVGLGIQDVAIASAVVQKALDSNGRIGTIVPKYDLDV